MSKKLFWVERLEIGASRVPIKVYVEYRNNVRFYLGRHGAIVRLPIAFSAQQRTAELDRFKQWVSSKLEEKAGYSTHFEEKRYQDGDVLQVGERKYALHITVRNSPSHCARLHNGHIYIELSSRDQDPESRNKAIRDLLSRLVAKDFYPEIIERVARLNLQHFNKPINKITLKYNLSNWGSCSTKGNINLSTCLLFAPSKVIDYVIIHELAHLVEMNHSKRFWALVEKAMPDYKEQIEWLKANWAHCKF